MKVNNFTALIFLYILQNQIKSDVLFRLRVALKKRMKILFFSIYPSLHRRRTVSGFKPVLCSRRTAVRQHQNNSQPLTFLSFDFAGETLYSQSVLKTFCLMRVLPCAETDVSHKSRARNSFRLQAGGRKLYFQDTEREHFPASSRQCTDLLSAT